MKATPFTIQTTIFEYSCRVFGELNIQPANGFKFWSAVESAMERNIDDLSAAEIVDLLLSIACLGHYPEAESEIVKTVLFEGGKHIQQHRGPNA